MPWLQKSVNSCTQFMKNLFAVIIVLLFYGCRQAANGSFTLTVKHYGAAAGITKVYKVTNQEISLETDCDFQDCKSEQVYKRPLTKAESDSFYQFLTTSGIDDLKAKYINEDVLDGLQSNINYNIPGLGSDDIEIINVEVPVAERLYREVDKYIDSAKFKFYRTD